MEALIKGAELKKAIGQLKKDAKGWVARIEHLAQSACVEAVATRNCSAINMLADATKEIGSRAVMRWLEKHGPVKWDKEENKFLMSDKKHEAMKAKGEEYAKELAASKSYVQEQTKADSNPFVEFDLRSRIASLIKQAEAKQADDNRKTEATQAGKADDFTGLTELKAMLATLPVKVSATAGKTAPKSKSGKGVTLTAATETVATA